MTLEHDDDGTEKNDSDFLSYARKQIRTAYCIGTPLYVIYKSFSFYGISDAAPGSKLAGTVEFDDFTDRSAPVFYAMAGLIAAQAILHFVFFFREKVHRQLSDDGKSYTAKWIIPRFVELNYWVTYRIIPCVLIAMLGLLWTLVEYSVAKALLLFLLLAQIGSLIWYQAVLHPRYCEAFADVEKEHRAEQYLKKKEDGSG